MKIFLRIACGVGVFMLGFLIVGFLTSGIFTKGSSDLFVFFIGALAAILFLSSVIVICTISIVEAIKKYHD